MRFCMVTTFYPPCHFGGDATYVRALSRALTAAGHEVEVVHCVDAYQLAANAPAPDEPEQEDGVTVHRLRSRFGSLSPLLTQQTGLPVLKSPALKKILQRDFDVIHYHNISLVGGPGVLRLGRAPVKLYTLHEHWLLCPTHIFWKNRSHACDKPQCIRCCLRSGIPPQWWRYTGLMRRSLEQVDALLAPSRFTAELHREANLVDDADARIRVLPLFSTLDPAQNRSPDSRPSGFVFAGRITASKGVEPLLQAFADMPDRELLVVGEGDLLASLRQRYASAANIRFTGMLPQAELVRLYQQASAVILPSLAPETFGLTVAEAFACGAPAIVRRAGGNAELIEDTGAGFIYENEAQLRQAVNRLAEEPDLRAQLGKLARQGFETRYTREQHLAAYLELIAGIGQRKGVNLH